MASLDPRMVVSIAREAWTGTMAPWAAWIMVENHIYSHHTEFCRSSQQTMPGFVQRFLLKVSVQSLAVHRISLR